MAEFQIERAERKHAKLRLAFCGPSGAGKTETSLLVAKGMVEASIAAGVMKGTLEGKIGVVDTERGSSKLYAHLVPFDVIDLTAPYTVSRYQEAIRTFVRADYAVIIVDQMSHCWSGSGGLLEQKDKIAKQAGQNGYTAFADITPQQNAFIEELLALPCHLIVTMRSKQAYVLEKVTNRQGREVTVPKRIGMEPIQRAGTEYEFTTVLNLEVEGNVAKVLKDRTEIFGPPNSECGRLGVACGTKLAEWLYTGAAQDTVPLSGTPAERFEALVKVWEGKIEHAATMPDLAKVFSEGWKLIQAFDIGGFLIKQGLERITKVKDERKAILAPTAGNAPQPGVTLITEDQAVELERSLYDNAIPDLIFKDKFGIQRLAQLPASKMIEAQDWIDAESVVRTGASHG